MKIKTRTLGSLVGILWICLGLEVSVLAQCPPPHPDPLVEQFVERLYHRGIPFGEALEFTKGNDSDVKQRVDTLNCLLKDKKKKAYWPNILTTMGIIGHPTVVDTMIEFANRPLPRSRSINWPLVRAKRSALIALGYVINKQKTEANTAVRFLCDRLEKKNSCAPPKQSKLETKKRKLTQKFKDLKSKVKTDVVTPYLQQAAILGLALSGSKEGENALRAIEKPSIKEAKKDFIDKIKGEISEFAPFSFNEILAFLPLFEEDKSTRFFKMQKKRLVQPRVDTPVEEARNAHEAIRQNGLECYYDPNCARPIERITHR